jgi:hypothetical protein
MSKMKRYRCPECSGTFEFFHHPNVEEDPAPRYCPLCGFDSHADEEKPYGGVIEAPHVRNVPVVKGGDNTYEAMVQASETNAVAAAEMAGVDASEMSNMKITDMKDNLREGDDAVAVDSTPVAQVMQQAPGVFGFQGYDSAAGYASAVRTGPEAFAGMKAASVVRAGHTDRVLATMASGKTG